MLTIPCRDCRVSGHCDNCALAIEQYLSIGADGLEHRGDSASTLREMVALPQGIAHGLFQRKPRISLRKSTTVANERTHLQDLLIVLRLRLLHLSRDTDIVFQVATHVLPGAETFEEEVCSLQRKGGISHWRNPLRATMEANEQSHTSLLSVSGIASSSLMEARRSGPIELLIVEDRWGSLVSTGLLVADMLGIVCSTVHTSAEEGRRFRRPNEVFSLRAVPGASVKYTARRTNGAIGVRSVFVEFVSGAAEREWGSK